MVNAIVGPERLSKMDVIMAGRVLVMFMSLQGPCFTRGCHGVLSWEECHGRSVMEWCYGAVSLGVVIMWGKFVRCVKTLSAGDDVTKKKPDPLIYNLVGSKCTG